MTLKEHIEKDYAGNASEFARVIGVSRQCINYWINGMRDPSLKLIRKIEKLTKGKVSRKDW